MRIGFCLNLRQRSYIVTCRQLRCWVIPARSASMTQNRLLPPTGPANLLPRRIGLKSMFCLPCYALNTSPSCPVQNLGKWQYMLCLASPPQLLSMCRCHVPVQFLEAPVWNNPMWSGCCMTVCCMTLDPCLSALSSVLTVPFVSLQ